MCLATHAPLNAEETRPPVRNVLPNGLTVIAQEDHSSRVTSISVFIKFGGVNETPTSAGIRYFLQQMLLRGTTRHTDEEIETMLAEIGASMDVTVGDDYVELYTTGGGSTTSRLIALTAEALTLPKFDIDEIEKLRKDLLGQVDGFQDNVRAWAYQALRDSLYRGADGKPVAYALPPIGSKESLRRIQREDLTRCFHTYYVPGNMVLSIVGDFDSAETTQQIEAAFGNLPAGTLPPVPNAECPDLEESVLAVKERDVESAWLLAGVALPPVTDPDYVPLRVLSTLLGEGMGSRLYKDLRTHEAIAYEAATSFTPRLLSDELVIYLQTAPMSINLAKERIFANLDDLRDNPVAPAELNRAIEYLVGTFALSHQRTRERAWHYAQFECLGLGYQFDHGFAQKARQVTPADIQRVCKKYLNSMGMVLVMPSPF